MTKTKGKKRTRKHRETGAWLLKQGAQLELHKCQCPSEFQREQQNTYIYIYIKKNEKKPRQQNAKILHQKRGKKKRTERKEKHWPKGGK